MVPDTLSIRDRYRLFTEASLPLSVAILIVLAVLLFVLGLLLFPVNLGIIPFSPDGQLGLLLVITAIQMMALGETPLGQFKRSWLLMLIGIGFASMGVVSCIVPGILTDIIRILLGILNILSGVIFLMKQGVGFLHNAENPSGEPVPVPPLLNKLKKTQTILSIVSIAFGITMLIPGLVSGLIISGIVVVNGLLLFYLASILQKLG